MTTAPTTCKSMKCLNMKLSEAFPSNYIKAADLQGRDVTLTIRETIVAEIGKDKKLVTYFVGKEKGMVTNKTNADRIAYYHGDDTDGWRGKQVVLGTELTTFEGKTAPALRIKGIPQVAAEPIRPVAVVAESPFDDEIPF